MNFIAYIKNILLLAFLCVIFSLLYPIIIEHTPIHLRYKDGIIYTTQNALIIGTAFSSILLFTTLKFVYIFIARTFFIPDILLFVKKIFSNHKDDNNILEQIKKLQKNGEYKYALNLTKSNIQNSSEILFQHFIILLRLRTTGEFLHTFKKYQCGKAIPLFISCTKEWSHWRKNLFISHLYNANPNNDVITYLHAQNLEEVGKTNEAHTVITNFINNKVVFFRDRYTFFLFNKLALKLEMQLSVGSTDFATSYIENIKNYQKDFPNDSNDDQSILENEGKSEKSK